MSYKNVIDHPHFGEMWYEVTLRNWNGMGNTREQNLAMGPCFELMLCEYGIVAGGTTLLEAEEELQKTLDYLAERGMIVPRWSNKPLSWWQKRKLKRLVRETCNPV
jgi:hypothetical protein